MIWQLLVCSGSIATNKQFWKANILGWFFVIIGFAGCAFIPNKNEALLIIAGGATMNYIQKDTSLSKIGPQTTAIISQYLDSKLKELDKIGEKVKD